MGSTQWVNSKSQQDYQNAHKAFLFAFSKKVEDIDVTDITPFPTSVSVQCSREDICESTSYPIYGLLRRQIAKGRQAGPTPLRAVGATCEIKKNQLI